MANELTKEEYDEAVAENRHEAVIELLGEIVKALYQDKEADMSLVLSNQTSLIKRINENLLRLPAPQVNVTTDPLLLKEISRVLSAVVNTNQMMQVKDDKEREWEFTVYRDEKGYIKTVNAKQII